MAEHYFMQGNESGIQTGENKVWNALAVDCIHKDLSKEDTIQALVSVGMNSKEAEQLYDRLLSSDKEV